jgi:dihydroneopterin aldolase
MMSIQSSYIFLRNLRFHASHGVMPQERVTGNDYEVSLRIGYDLSRAMHTDDVADTLNYADVYRLVEQEMSVPANLLERVACRMAERLFSTYPAVTSLDLRLIKLNPPMGADADGAGVELHLINDKTD